LPPINAEPLVGVLLARAPQVRVRLLQPVRAADGRTIAVGVYTVRAQGGGIRFGGLAVQSAPLCLHGVGSGACFQLDGDGRRYGGSLELALSQGQVAVVERVAMESYLAGVIAKEVEPDWPAAALAAQAVAARSYAMAQWQRHHRRAWQLDASEQVDMAYAGLVVKPHPHLQAALDQTRGQLLWYADQVLPAYFHAASGGHTEDISQIWPQRTCPDGRTKPGGAMPPRADPWDRAGRAVAPKRLGAWKVDLPLAEVEARLRAAGKAAPGALLDLRITDRETVSGRARRLRCRFSAGHIDLSAHQLRMALGSTAVKSTLWRDFRLVAGRLIVQGHGYGHGIGLPQASAWAMARSGHDYPAILAQYYPGAGLVDRW
jgi:SpoIID/LytB domain protein